MDNVYVKPSEGARIRQPERGGTVMPDAGALVPRDTYYERLIITGDVVETDPPAAPAPGANAHGIGPDTDGGSNPDFVQTEPSPPPPDIDARRR